MKTKTRLLVGICATAIMLGAVYSVGAIDLLEKYPTRLTAGDAKPENARAWEFVSGDVYHLSKFSLEVGKDLKIETGAAHVGIAHCQDGAVWAVVIPNHGGKMTSTVAKGAEEILHVWLRFHPKEIARVFLPDTVSEGGTTNLMQQMRDVAAVKFRSSWHAGMRAMIPEPKDMTVDADTKGGPRRFFMVNTEAGAAEYVGAFEDQSLQPSQSRRETKISLETAPPVVVKTTPVAGATDVDPSLGEIRVTYSKAMQDGSWSWSTWGEENYPETTGQPKYLGDARTCVLPVKLQPRKFYAIWLNSDKFKNFKDTSGRSAAPYLLTFFTGGSETSRPAPDLTAAEGIGAVVAQKIKREVTRQMKELGAKVDDVLVTVAVARDSATPFKVTYRGLRNFKSSAGTPVSPPDGDFIMNYIGGGQWQGALAGITFTAQVGTVDKIDLPFVNDPKVIGRWETVDFVPRPSDFNPEKPAWRGGEFFFKGFNFLENGKFPEAWQTWTKGFVIHHGDKTASHYEIREINGQPYMFVEWKSGDVTIMGRKPSFCVLKKTADSDSPSAGESIAEHSVNKLVSEFPTGEDLSTPESACAAWLRANARKDAKAVCAMSLTPLGPKEQENWYLRMEQTDAEGLGIYLKALAESKIVTVQVWRDDLANVITFLPFPEGKGREPFSARFFGLVNGAWKNLGEDRLPDLNSAKANFERKKDRLWERFLQLRASARSATNSDDDPKVWLKEARVDLDKVDLKTAPVTQVMIEDVQPDGSCQFRSVIRQVNSGNESQKKLQFMNSDIVELQRLCDADGNNIPFTSIREDNHFRYTATLLKPVPPGAVLVYGSEGTVREVVTPDAQSGTFTYKMKHFPASGAPTRRVEVHRLPPGAELLVFSSGASRRDAGGRIELVVDELVAPGGSVSLSYRYRIAAASPEKKADASDGSIPALLNEDQRAVFAWTDRQFRSFFDARSFDGWSEKDRADLEARLIDALSGPQNREYYQAINTLGAMRSAKALPKLREIAFNRADRNNRDRWMAVRVLGIMGDKASVPELIHLVYHGNQNTHWWAQISLVRLTGQNFGKDWNAWGKWWNDQKGEPPYKPEIIRWWNGQPEPDKLAASLEEGDRKFLDSLEQN